MKPFDLERALSGDPIQTRSGKPFIQIHKFDTKDDDCLYGVVDGEVLSFTKDGRFNPSYGISEYDLFMAPKVREYWVNVYRNKNGSLEMGAEYESEEKAKSEKDAASSFSLTYITTIKLTEEV